MFFALGFEGGSVLTDFFLIENFGNLKRKAYSLIDLYLNWHVVNNGYCGEI